MKKEKIINILIIVIFLNILILPHILYFCVKDKLPKDTSENRALASRPKIELANFDKFPGDFDNYFNDHLPFRVIIQRIYNNINYYIFKVRSFNHVTIGKQTDDGNIQWLFFNNPNEGDPFQYAIGTKNFSEAEKEAFVINIKQNTKKLQDKNIDLYYFIAPEKSTIYKELLPKNIKIKNDINPTQDLCDYLKSENVENILYPYNELMEAKVVAPLYFSLDSHWNLYGGFVGASVLQNKIDSNYSYLFNEANISKGDYYEASGDLSRILNISGIRKFKEQKINIENFLDDSKYIVTDNTVVYNYLNEDALIDKNLVIIGDSYNDAISNNFAKMYSKITYFPVYAYTPEFLDSLNPDIVIIEAVERNIDKIIHFTM